MRPTQPIPLPRHPMWRTLAKLALLGLVLGATFAGGRQLGELARREAPTLFGPANAVAALDADPARVIYEEAPHAASALLDGPGEHYLNAADPDRPAAVWADPRARDVYALLSGEPSGVMDHGAQALLARLTTAAGHARVVSVRYLPPGWGGGSGLAGFLIETFDLDAGRRVFRAFVADVAADLGRDFRLFAGAAEADDRFTIAYEAGDAAGVLSGRLLDDARTVEFGIAGGPVAAAPALLRSALLTH